MKGYCLLRWLLMRLSVKKKMAQLYARLNYIEHSLPFLHFDNIPDSVPCANGPVCERRRCLFYVGHTNADRGSDSVQMGGFGAALCPLPNTLQSVRLSAECSSLCVLLLLRTNYSFGPPQGPSLQKWRWWQFLNTPPRRKRKKIHYLHISPHWS